MFEETLVGPAPLATPVKVLLTIWFLILVPWVPIFALMGSGMAFEGGYTFDAYLFVFAAWLYPALVFLAWLFRRRRPKLVWLPAVPIFYAIVELLRPY